MLLRQASEQFPRYGRWKRLNYDVEQSVLAATLGALMKASSSDVTLLQATARCEVTTSNKCIAVRKIATPLPELTCHMGSHSVTCHPAEVTL